MFLPSKHRPTCRKALDKSKARATNCFEQPTVEAHPNQWVIAAQTTSAVCRTGVSYAMTVWLTEDSENSSIWFSVLSQSASFWYRSVSRDDFSIQWSNKPTSVSFFKRLPPNLHIHFRITWSFCIGHSALPPELRFSEPLLSNLLGWIWKAAYPSLEFLLSGKLLASTHPTP